MNESLNHHNNFNYKKSIFKFFFDYFRQKNNTDLRHAKANKMTEYSKLIFQRLG